MDGAVVKFHGLSVDCIRQAPAQLRHTPPGLLADITFGTNNEIGFDYLRDNMAISPKTWYNASTISHRRRGRLRTHRRRPYPADHLGSRTQRDHQLFEQPGRIERLYNVQSNLPRKPARQRPIASYDEGKNRKRTVSCLYRATRAAQIQKTDQAPQ